MKKDKWHDYWQRRAVKAEEVLTRISVIADRMEYEDIALLIGAYYESVAAGEVKDTPLSDGDKDSA